MQTPFDQRENNFDSIRMALAVLVIFSHSYPLGTGSEIREPLVLLTHKQVTAGHMAVDLFFIISGFLITASVVVVGAGHAGCEAAMVMARMGC
jgi:peptidoglycan/LPS O-acetylase OafA/YrhL